MSHSTPPVAKRVPGGLLALRWLARVWSVASIALIAALLTSDGTSPTFSEVVALAFFPVGVVVGMAIGWWREGLGGAITVASLAGFYAWMLAADGRMPRGPWFVLFAAPGLLFGVCALLGRHRDPSRSRSNGGGTQRERDGSSGPRGDGAR